MPRPAPRAGGPAFPHSPHSRCRCDGGVSRSGAAHHDESSSRVRRCLCAWRRADRDPASLIEVQATIAAGTPGFQIIGVPGDDTWALRDRVRAAVLNSGLAWPVAGITVGLGPASLFRRGCGLDLAIAVAVLAASGAVPPDAGAGRVFAAELGLDGHLRPVRGIVPILAAAASRGKPVTAVVAPGNQPEAALLPGITVAPYESLRQVAAWLRGEQLRGDPSRPARSGGPPGPGRSRAPALGALGVAPVLRRALEVSAAGGHHLCLTGPGGIGVPALANGLASLLPDLTGQEATEAAVIQSGAGLLGAGCSRIVRPPLRVPHHTCTMAAMTASGTDLRPGEAALAHGGVLCLPDAPEFERGVLQSLWQPLADREMVIARGGCIARFPARFVLVAAMRPCPCGGGSGCACAPLRARRYRERVTGTLGAWLPLRLTAGPSEPAWVTGGQPGQDADTRSAVRVAGARDRMRRRLAGTPWRLNGDIPRGELHRSLSPSR